MIRWLILAATAVARLGGGPNLVENENVVEKIGNAAKSDVAAEAPARRTRSFHITKKFIEDGVDDQRLLRSAETIAPTPITYDRVLPRVLSTFQDTCTMTMAPATTS